MGEGLVVTPEPPAWALLREKVASGEQITMPELADAIRYNPWPMGDDGWKAWSDSLGGPDPWAEAEIVMPLTEEEERKLKYANPKRWKRGK